MNWLLFLFPLLLLTGVAAIYFYQNWKRAQRHVSLVSETENYRNVIDQANDAMLVIDIVDGRIHQVNPSAATLFGYSPDELLQKTLFDLQLKTDLDKSSRIVADVWDKGGLIFSDIPFVTGTGDIIPVECSARVTPFGGRPAIVIYARDIRERLRLERELQEKAAIIEQKNRDITDSINYARRIQQSILPTDHELTDVMPEHFIFYQPKDIVSGDFYWATRILTALPGEYKTTRLRVIAAVDCTGHGVPGAFMSIIGQQLLNQVKTEMTVNSPGDALGFIHRQLLETLKQGSSDEVLRDGMDMAMCAINYEEGWMDYAGANNPLYMIRNGQLQIFKADKQPIGRYAIETKPFTTHRIALQPGDSFYIFTDGITDQFGGPKGKKFKLQQLQTVLLEHHHLPMTEQQKQASKTIAKWMYRSADEGGSYAQTDDMLLIGFRIPQ